jgi:DNA primase
MGIVDFQVHRVLADADLDTPAGRDRALEEARKLIAVVPERSATRDTLIREVADRLDMPVDYVTAAPALARQESVPVDAPERPFAPAGSSPG